MKASGIVQLCQAQVITVHELSFPDLLLYLKIHLNSTKLSQIILSYFYVFFFNLILSSHTDLSNVSFLQDLAEHQSKQKFLCLCRLWFCGVLIQLSEFSSGITDDFLNLSHHKLFAKTITFVSLSNLCRFFLSSLIEEDMVY